MKEKEINFINEELEKEKQDRETRVLEFVTERDDLEEMISDLSKEKFYYEEKLTNMEIENNKKFTKFYRDYELLARG